MFLKDKFLGLMLKFDFHILFQNDFIKIKQHQKFLMASLLFQEIKAFLCNDILG